MGNVSPPRVSLPLETSDFVGRRQELREIKRLLEKGRLVTLIGPGGVGKTRLSVRLGAEVARAFPDGVCLVQLSEVDDPELVPAAVLEALGVRHMSAACPLDVLVEHLRAAGLLVVLDNCEHVLGGCRDVVSAVLSACPGVRILATSQHRLNTEGEHLFEVRPLPLPPQDVVRPSEALANPVVQLFQNRAAMVRPGFTVDTVNAQAVVEVCRRTEGIPLAIELAAARLRSLSPSQLLDAMQDRFHALARGHATAPQRQRTLRGMVEWSFELCTDAQRALWLRSCVFAGSFDVEAATAVCTGQGVPRAEVLDLVQDLVDKSVLQPEDDGQHTRYCMLDTLRDYGREQLAERGELAHWQSRHREWCRALVQRAAEESFGPAQREWAQRLRVEQSDLRAALGSALTGPAEADTGLEIAAALRFYWFTSALLTEGRRWLHLLLDMTTEATPARVAALEVAGYLATLQGDVAAARLSLAQARELGARLGDQTGLVRVAYAEGLLRMLTGNRAEAVPLFNESLELQQSVGGRPSVMSALTCSHLSVMASVAGDVDAGTEWCARALRMSEEAGEVWCRAFALWASGIAALRGGDPDRAVCDETASLRLNRSYGDKVHSGLAVEALAWAAAAKRDHKRAVKLLGGLDTAWRDMGAGLFGHVVTLHDEYVAQCRAALREAGYVQAFDDGRGLPFDDLVALALDEPSPTTVPVRARTDDSPLTPREQEVAALIASGKSNKDIAKTLVIALRTAEGHVERILDKLGFTSRTQIGVWMAAREHPDA